MQKLNGYEKATVFTEREKLPVGGYILKIIKAEIETFTWGDQLKIAFDICEGQYRNFYKKDFDSQQENKKWKGVFRLPVPADDGSESDEYKMRRFKSAMMSIEASNQGFTWNWDEKSLIGKTVGAIFRNKEWSYNNRTGFFTECYSFRDVETIRSGKFKIPEDKLLNKNNDGYEGFEEIDNLEVPF